MNSLISMFVAFCCALLSFFGVPFQAPDLKDSDVDFGVEVNGENLKLLKRIFDTETAWLASLQLDNGAIPMTYSVDGVVKMNPYFADIAAIALLDNSEKYAINVKRYMDWHFAHLNTSQEDINGLDGTIYDYNITVLNGKVISEDISIIDGKKSYDSTDSYAATFLSLLNKYRQKTDDIEYLYQNKEDIMRIVEAMLSTFHNGLTCARPDYVVKYLMDNCEVRQAALDTAELLESVFGLDDEVAFILAGRCRKVSAQIEHTVNYKLWNFVGDYYNCAVSKYGRTVYDSTWENYYPFATSQLFPIVCGLIAPDCHRAVNLYEKFCDSYDWETFNIPDDFYWGTNVYAAAMVNDVSRVVEYMKNYEPLTQKHAYPLYNADIARVSMAAYVMLQNNGVTE